MHVGRRRFTWQARLRSAHLTGRSHAGDTIVEVLIALAVVGLVLITAYVVTNHNTRSIQDAQERSQALQLAQSQLEFLRLNHPLTGSNVCFGSDGSQKQSSATLGQDPCTVNASGQMAGANDVPAYRIHISSPDDGITYQVAVTWDSLLASQPGQKDTVTLYYEVQ